MNDNEHIDEERLNEISHYLDEQFNDDYKDDILNDIDLIADNHNHRDDKYIHIFTHLL